MSDDIFDWMRDAFKNKSTISMGGVVAINYILNAWKIVKSNGKIARPTRLKELFLEHKFDEFIDEFEKVKNKIIDMDDACKGVETYGAHEDCPMYMTCPLLAGTELAMKYVDLLTLVLANETKFKYLK